MRQTVIGILKDERGVLTLLEMLTVMAILAILIVTLLPAQDAVINDAKAMATAEDLEMLKKALLKFHADIGVWPLSSDNGGSAAPSDGLADVNLMGDTCGASGTTENAAATNSPGILCQGNTAATVSIGPKSNGSFTTASGQFLVRKWRGPYIRREIKSNPFGGSYVLSLATLPKNEQPGHKAFMDGVDSKSVLIQATRIPKSAAVAIDRLLDDGDNNKGFVQYTTDTLTLTFVVDGF